MQPTWVAVGVPLEAGRGARALRGRLHGRGAGAHALHPPDHALVCQVQATTGIVPGQAPRFRKLARLRGVTAAEPVPSKGAHASSAAKADGGRR